MDLVTLYRGILALTRMGPDTKLDSAISALDEIVGEHVNPTVRALCRAIRDFAQQSDCSLKALGDRALMLELWRHLSTNKETSDLVAETAALITEAASNPELVSAVPTAAADEVFRPLTLKSKENSHERIGKSFLFGSRRV